MINKINNISFKGVFFDQSINNMKPANFEKLKLPVKMCSELYPDTDVFMGSDNKGELFVRVQKGEPLLNLLDDEVLDVINVSPKELVALVTAAIQAKYAHNSLYNIKEPFVTDCTKNIDELESVEIAYKLNRLIKDFRQIHQKDWN